MENVFAFSGEAKNKKYATEIIHECHEAWRRLIMGETPAKTPSYDLSMCVIYFGPRLVIKQVHFLQLQLDHRWLAGSRQEK